MSEIPYCRFGFTEPSGSVQYTENLRADHCCKALGDEHWPLLQQTPKQHVPALLAFISATKSIHDVPKELLDLRQEGAEVFTPWTVTVARERFNNELFYIIRPRGLPLENTPSIYCCRVPPPRCKSFERDGVLISRRLSFIY
ncbi:hypothetical protein B0H10DRAFT_1921381 [Mycena sp. CBHHK59/15]|nr:hypothetical protein B0H10DRAFT_1921381 [Mycena sp. CBHHK59/15]